MGDTPRSKKGVQERSFIFYVALTGLAFACLLLTARRTHEPVQLSAAQAKEARCSRAAAAAAHTNAVWPSNLPSWFDKGNAEQLFGRPRESRYETGGYHGSQWAEDVYAFNHFFHGLVSGSYLEIGGLDGVRYSNTLWYHQHMAWRGMLVEGSPRSYASLMKNRPHDITVNAAICSNATTVHYAQHNIGAVSGIIEFMSEGFKKHWYQQLEAAAKIEVPCVPLHDLLAHYNIRHVDFFSLDVEGGELGVLESIDFDCFSFNVAVVELDGTNKAKDDHMRSLLAGAGYSQYSHVHNNTWFVRQGFTPFPAPKM